jgi:hypothetical protein
MQEDLRIVRKFIQGQIIHSFVKTWVMTKFNFASGIVNPERILLGTTIHVTMMSSFLGVDAAFL